MKEFLKRHHLDLLVVAGFVLGVAVTLGALQFDGARRLFLPSSGNGVFSGKPAAPMTAPSPMPVAAATPRPLPTAAPTPGLVEVTQDAVKAYMKKYTAPGSTLAFLDWSDFVQAGKASAITLRYRVVKETGENVEAAVRFVVQDGAILKTEVINTGADASSPAPPAGGGTPAPVVVDHFTAPIQAAMSGPPMTIAENTAYSLSQLEGAKQEAQLERKPIGFVMVWGMFFGVEADTRANDSVSALVHFYEAFHQNLVLVFVRHETELQLVPPAVKRGFFSEAEGGYAPNMAVTDASASEFITEIPYKHLDGPGRDQIFAEGGKKIDEWLATHPSAMASPSP
jgi:hypothetical protein